MSNATTLKARDRKDLEEILKFFGPYRMGADTKDIARTTELKSNRIRNLIETYGEGGAELIGYSYRRGEYWKKRGGPGAAGATRLTAGVIRTMHYKAGKEARIARHEADWKAISAK